MNGLWVMFAVVFGGMGLVLMYLGSLSGYLMCMGVLGWLFVANNTGQLFTEDEDEDENYQWNVIKYDLTLEQNHVMSKV